eukprot:m.307655 g.307655  ORF g.307655 m.307655 type:complete len:105 (+) comp16463_c1_seq16:1501-1815(+)
MDEFGLSQLISSVPQRGVFIARHMTYAISYAAAIGFAGGLLSNSLLGINIAGPLFPYLIGSQVGFVIGTISFWKQEQDRAINWAFFYPNVNLIIQYIPNALWKK